eukprot:4709691-Heterocapsa_arctica.AAC.1
MLQVLGAEQVLVRSVSPDQSLSGLCRVSVGRVNPASEIDDRAAVGLGAALLPDKPNPRLVSQFKQRFVENPRFVKPAKFPNKFNN